MNLATFSYDEVLEIAINIEKRGYELYTSAAKITKSDPAKNILLFLADQEKGHEEIFRKLHKDVKEKGQNNSIKLSKESTEHLKSIADSSIFPADDEQFLEKVNTLDDIIKVAKQAEKDSILFYVELSNYAPDEASEDFYKLIIQEEKEHLIKIQELDRVIKERGVVY
ncbi:MAG TPA: ferritin family protein [Clostridia bacterium]|nr:ferritin family protein [Clostridia bacterium]